MFIKSYISMRKWHTEVYKVDYYKRKQRAQLLVKSMLKDGYKDEEICFAIEDQFQMSPNSTTKYLERLRGSL